MPDTQVRERSGLPRVFDAVVECPGGEFVGEALEGSGCHSRIEHSGIFASTSPRSLIAYCMGDYRTCPTWRAEKERVWARKRGEPVGDALV